MLRGQSRERKDPGMKVDCIVSHAQPQAMPFPFPGQLTTPRSLGGLSTRFYPLKQGKHQKADTDLLPDGRSAPNDVVGKAGAAFSWLTVQPPIKD